MTIYHYEKFQQDISIDYLPSDNEHTLLVTDLSGQFIGCELFAVELKSNEGIYVNHKVKIDTYRHLGLNSVEDATQLRRLYGAYENAGKV